MRRRSCSRLKLCGPTPEREIKARQPNHLLVASQNLLIGTRAPEAQIAGRPCWTGVRDGAKTACGTHENRVFLQEERKALGQQCTWLMSDTQCSTRHPQPYVVAAVNHICDKEIETAAAAVAQLRAWRWKSLGSASRSGRRLVQHWVISTHKLYAQEHVELAPLCQRPAVHERFATILQGDG